MKRLDDLDVTGRVVLLRFHQVGRIEQVGEHGIVDVAGVPQRLPVEGDGHLIAGATAR